MTNSIVIISLNDLSRDFWKFHLNNPGLRIWQWKTGFPTKEMIDLLNPVAIILDDYFTRKSEDEVNSFIPRLLNLDSDVPVHYISPRFSTESEKLKFFATGFRCSTFSREVLEHITSGFGNQRSVPDKTLKSQRNLIQKISS